jgi:hypothetical protein
VSGCGRWPVVKIERPLYQASQESINKKVRLPEVPVLDFQSVVALVEAKVSPQTFGQHALSTWTHAVKTPVGMCKGVADRSSNAERYSPRASRSARGVRRRHSGWNAGISAQGFTIQKVTRTHLNLIICTSRLQITMAPFR